MGFFKKLFGTAVVTSAAVGSAVYIKKRKDNRDISEDTACDHEKIFDVNTADDGNGKAKVTITINKKKAKNMADTAADKVIDATDKLKDTVSEKIGEENTDAVMEKMNEAKNKISNAANTAKDKAMDVRDKVVQTVGEDNIQYAKEKVMDAANMAKDKVSETVDKFVSTTKDYCEDDFVDEDVEPVTSSASDLSQPKDSTDTEHSDTDFLEDELNEL